MGAVGVALVCSIPESYPDVVPVLEIEVEKGLGKQQKQELTELVEQMVCRVWIRCCSEGRDNDTDAWECVITG